MKCSKRTVYYITEAVSVPSTMPTVSERLRRSWHRPAGRHASEGMRSRTGHLVYVKYPRPEAYGRA